MALFLIERRTPLPPPEAWRRLTDWHRHGRVAPLTAVTVRRRVPDGGLGTYFVARTRLGRLGFDDPMEVTVWQPPADGCGGRCRLDKRGRVVTGWASIAVTRDGDGSRVRWEEELRVRGVPGAAAPLVRRAGALVFGRAVDRLLATP